MANILTAQVAMYGEEKSILKLVNALKDKGVFFHDNIYIAFNEAYTMADFRWNISSALDNKDIRDICKENKVAISAHGYEPGLGFYEAIGINHKGEIVQDDSWNIHITSVWFDQSEKTKTGE